jgi:hypothetical protein
MRRKKPGKPYWEMTAEELAAATADLDQEFVIDKFRPLTPQQKAQWERAKRKVSKPNAAK